MIIKKMPVLILIMGFFTGIITSSCNKSNPYKKHALPADPLIRQALQTLVNGLQNPDSRIRSATIEIIAQTRQTRLLLRVRTLLRDQSVPVRFAALLAIGDMQYALAKSDILQIFNETRENINIRMAAAYALTKLGYKKYEKFYFNAINNTNPTVRANAALLMGKTNNKKSIKMLYWALSDINSNETVRCQVIEAIAMLGHSDIYQKIWSRLISAFADDRISAIKAMGALGTGLCRDALLTMLNDPVTEVRIAAAEQLGKLGDYSGKEILLDALNTKIQGNTPEKIRIKIMTAMAIAQIKTDDLTRYLPQLLSDPSEFVQIAAAKAVLL